MSKKHGMTWKSRNALAMRISDEARRLGYQSAEPYYLFEAYDEVPEGFTLPTLVDPMEPFCHDCGSKLLVQNGYDPDPSWKEIKAYRDAHDGADLPYLHQDSGESDSHHSCPGCGKHLDTSYTTYCCEQEAAGYSEDDWIHPYELTALAHLVDQTDWQDGPLKMEVENIATDCLERRLRVTASQERDARIRDAGQAITTAIAGVSKSLGWLKRMAEPIYYSDEED
jgi:hypothetical protein